MIPDIFTDVAEVAEAGEIDSLTDAATAETEADHYGSSLSFDWRTGRFRLDASGNPIVVTGPESIVEDLVKALLTARHDFAIYSADYGAEFWELVGTDRDFAIVEVQRVVNEVATADPRVRAVENLKVEPGPQASLRVSFSVRDFTDEVVAVPEVVVRYA